MILEGKSQSNGYCHIQTRTTIAFLLKTNSSQPCKLDNYTSKHHLPPPKKKIWGIRITFTNKFTKSPSQSISAVGIGITWRAQWPTPWPRQICTGNPRISSGSKPLNMVLDLIRKNGRIFQAGKPYKLGRESAGSQFTTCGKRRNPNVSGLKTPNMSDVSEMSRSFC